jgi:hypothetical protein
MRFSSSTATEAATRFVIVTMRPKMRFDVSGCAQCSMSNTAHQD